MLCYLQCPCEAVRCEYSNIFYFSSGSLVSFLKLAVSSPQSTNVSVASITRYLEKFSRDLKSFVAHSILPLQLHYPEMAQPQEPAWPRTYKSRAAPFSAANMKAPIRVMTPPPPTPPQKRTKRQEQPTSESGTRDTISIAFPSTMSLGLKSFGQPPESRPDSSIHPALRGDSTGDTVHDGSSDSSSMRTKVEVGYKSHSYGKIDDETTGGWRRVAKSLIRMLGCGASRD